MSQTADRMARILDRMARDRYATDMSNAQYQSDADGIQRARARHLRELFVPWTYRKLAARTGLGRSTLQSRLTGETSLTLPDIEVLAPVIRMTADELFSELVRVKLPDHDSSVEPAGFTLRPVTNLPTHATEHTADVLPFRPRAA